MTSPGSAERRTRTASSVRLIKRLIERLHRSASQSVRAKAVRSMLRPLSPLALAAVADGSFAFALVGGMDDNRQLAEVASARVAQLADFAYQVDPGALLQAAEMLASPAAGTAFAAAVVALLLRELPALRTRLGARD